MPNSCGRKAAGAGSGNVKLARQLGAIRRELIANPKKALVLLVLLAAAGWFWGPILWRKLAPAAVPATASSVRPDGKSAASSVSAPLAVERRAADPANSPVDWRKLLAVRQRDPLTRPAVFDPQWPEPFKVAAAAATELAASEAGQHPSALLTPAELGLVLESIVYGKTTRAAVINGEVYHEGAEISASTAQGTAVSFDLVRIERTSVALKRHDRSFWLEFPRPKLTGSNRIEPQRHSAAETQVNQP